MLLALYICTSKDEALLFSLSGSTSPRSGVMIKIKGLDHANQMKHRAQHREDVKDLMRVSPDVKSSWLQALRKSSLFRGEVTVSHASNNRISVPTYRINQSASDIHASFNNQPPPPHLLGRLLATKMIGSMCHRHRSREQNEAKQHCAYESPLGGAKTRDGANASAGNGDKCDLHTTSARLLFFTASRICKFQKSNSNQTKRNKPRIKDWTNRHTSTE
jgi:hypothetical protein